MRKVRERLGAELFFVIFRRNVASVELIGTVPPQNIFTIRDTSLFHLVHDAFAFMLWARQRRIDCVHVAFLPADALLECCAIQ